MFPWNEHIFLVSKETFKCLDFLIEKISNDGYFLITSRIYVYVHMLDTRMQFFFSHHVHSLRFLFFTLHYLCCFYLISWFTLFMSLSRSLSFSFQIISLACGLILFFYFLTHTNVWELTWKYWNVSGREEEKAPKEFISLYAESIKKNLFSCSKKGQQERASDFLFIFTRILLLFLMLFLLSLIKLL